MLEQFKNIWLRVRDEYFGEFVVTEATLQAVLHRELRIEIPDVNVVAEPIWDINSGNRKPDLVIVENGCITDILELKFAPAWYPKYKNDIEKLSLYVENINEVRPARLDSNTGDWHDFLPIIDDCRLHFVVIAQHNAAAVCPNTVRNFLKQQIPKSQSTHHQLFHWWGRIGGNGDWDISQLI